jgi:hypothetical protein
MDAPCQTNGDPLQNLIFNSLVYQLNPRTAASTSVEAMNKERMSDQVAMTPSWPPLAQLLLTEPAPQESATSAPLQHHVQLGLVG